jgi:outer membrane protein assembly factor BamE (lipoprotein component of BamABCDE complex)
MERHRHPVNVSRRPARGFGATLGLMALLATGGCAWMPSVPGASLFESPRTIRGHQLDDETLAQITPGVSSRNDVESLLGSPSVTGTFDDSAWYYISGVTRQRPGRTLALEDQRVVAILFDGSGTVREVKRLGQDDARDVRVVSRVTPSPGNDRTLLQQLFGNLGRLGPGLGAGANTSVGAPSPTAR